MNTVTSAPEPPGPGQGWRWATIATGLALSAWNLSAAAAAYRRVGPLSALAFLHLWVFLAFSFPAAETTYRYPELTIGEWGVDTDDEVLLRAVLLLGAFLVIFFAALGRDFDRRLATRLVQARPPGPRPRFALLFLALLLPLVLARLLVLRSLGLQGTIATAVTRSDFLSQQFETGLHPLLLLLNIVFPILAVTLLCLVLKYLVPHPTARGRRLYVLTLVSCVAGVALTGGRADLVYVVFTVVLFLYVCGYRSLRQFMPVLAPMAAVAGLLFLVAQARTGQSNALTALAGNPLVGHSYVSGDVTQILGLGRFDAVVMILDRHDVAANLQGASYWSALIGGLNATWFPRIALGEALVTWHVTDSVLGPWVFGEVKGSPLPSAPGELYLNFGTSGILVGALALGLMARALLRLPERLGGSMEFPWLLAVWTLARFLTDESYVIANFAGRNWLVMLLLSVLLLRHAPTWAGSGTTLATAHQAPSDPRGRR